MNHPLISIVMPTYNSEKTIKKSIQSIIEQSYSNWELLITDDCSSDNTVDIVNSFSSNDHRISFIINATNSGAGFSRNASIARSTGKYIAFLDSDDIWLPEKLSTQVNYMEDTGALFTYTSYQKFSEDKMGGVIVPPSQVTYDKLLYGNVIGCLTAMFNAEVLGRQRMPLIRKRQDMGLWLSLLKQCQTAYAVPGVLALYRTDSGMTQNKLNAAKYQWVFYRKVVGLNICQAAWYFSWYTVNGFIKYRK